ncbi:MAG TPA: LCP family protein [Anaerolineaceae bacterium]|nr:LCP family protein [Anaerolineaceae bacterium]
MTWRDPYPTPPDPYGQTQPSHPELEETSPIEAFQPIRIQPDVSPAPPPQPRRPARRSRSWGCGCGCIPLLLIAIAALAAYFLAPLRTNILVMGIDVGEGRAPAGSYAGRSDTMILLTVIPLKPYVGMLSIPRDLWVPIPGHGENRINTANFFAEADRPGSGPEAVKQVIRDNFGVDIQYYARARFESFQDVIDAMGGVDVTLPREVAGLPAGPQHLNGQQALAFVRSRKEGDDFNRMEDQQILLIAAAKQLLNPLEWPRVPAVFAAVMRNLDTNIPLWQWPRLGLALLRAGPQGIDNHTLTREMVQPFTTSGGAQVLGPNWDRIRPQVRDIFGP